MLGKSYSNFIYKLVGLSITMQEKDPWVIMLSSLKMSANCSIFTEKVLGILGC